MKQFALKFNPEIAYKTKNSNYFLNSFKREKVLQNLKSDALGNVMQYPLKIRIKRCVPQFVVQEEL